MMMEESVCVIPASYPQPVEEDEAQSQSQPKRVRMQQDSEDIQEQDNEPNANVVQSDNEQEQIVDSNSSPENSDDSSETNDDEDVQEVPGTTQVKKSIPLVVQACFKVFKLLKTKRVAKCKQCGEAKSDGLNSTGNWMRHIRLPSHKKSFKKYEKLLKKRKVVVTPVTHYFQSKLPKYDIRSAQQKRIRRAMVNFIIKKAMPLTLVEEKEFREMVDQLDIRFNHLTRRMVRGDIGNMYSEQTRSLKDLLSSEECKYISLTVDLWSDRRMRSYMGVTAHFIENDQLSRAVLCCQKFDGKHTAENIRDCFGNVLETYGITGKISAVLSDNAANMAKAFSVTFPVRYNEETPQLLVDDGELWKEDGIFDTDLYPETEVEDHTSEYQMVHLRCYAHSLQLAVKDGLQELKPIYRTMAKCSKISSLLHSSTTVQEEFSKKFGETVGLPQPVPTRWNSVLRHINSFLKKDMEAINSVMAAAHQDIEFTNLEWVQLRELSDILAPFAEATDLTQGDQQTTLSYVVPSVLSLEKFLASYKPNKLSRMVTELKRSLRERFSGIFSWFNVRNLTVPRDRNELFSSEMYMLAMLCDPNCLTGAFDT